MAVPANDLDADSSNTRALAVAKHQGDEIFARIAADERGSGGRKADAADPVQKQQIGSLRLRGMINDLVVWIRDLFLQNLSQLWGTVSQDDGYGWFTLNVIYGTVKAKLSIFFSMSWNGGPFIMAVQRLDSGLIGIHLVLGIAGDRILMDSPVIENLRDVENLSGLLGCLQDEIVILGAIAVGGEAADLQCKLSPDGIKVCDVVAASQIVSVEVWFEGWIMKKERLAAAKHVFIRIQGVWLDRGMIDRADELEQSILLEKVIMIQKRDIGAASHLKGSVRVA